MSESKKGYTPSCAWKTPSEETRRKMSETRKRIGNVLGFTMKGRKHSFETKQKMRKAALKEGGTLDAHGYRRLNLESTERKLEHRLVMEKEMGRELKDREIVHHWNENKLDNGRENLALFRSASPHMRLHLFAKRHKLRIEALRFDQPWLTVKI